MKQHEIKRHKRILASEPNIVTKPGDPAIHRYTESGNYSNSANAILRSGEPDELTIQIRDGLNESLRRLPPDPALRHEPLYRRIRADSPSERDALLARYVPGRIVTELAFTSTSRWKDHPKYRDRKVEFVIYSHSGRDIAHISAKPWEREVLIPAGARFKVRRVLSKVESLRIQIVLVEVE